MKIEVTTRLFGAKVVVPVPGLSDTQWANRVKVISWPDWFLGPDWLCKSCAATYSTYP
jgi:hypothetical protein